MNLAITEFYVNWSSWPSLLSCATYGYFSIIVTARSMNLLHPFWRWKCCSQIFGVKLSARQYVCSQHLVPIDHASCIFIAVKTSCLVRCAIICFVCQSWQPGFSGLAVALTVLLMAGSGVTSCAWLNLHSSVMGTHQVVSRTMTHVVCRRSLTMEAGVRSQTSPCRICGRQNASRQFRPRTLMFHSLSIIPPMLHIRLYLHATLFGNTTLRILETFHKAMLFRSLVGIGYKITFSCFWRDKNKQASQLIGLTVCLINTLGQTCSGAETSRGRREKQM